MLQIINQYLIDHGHKTEISTRPRRAKSDAYTYDDYIIITDNTETTYATIYHHKNDNTYTLYSSWHNTHTHIDLTDPNSLPNLLTLLQQIQQC